MYKLGTTSFDKPKPTCVIFDGNTAIPFDPANTDYANFKKEVLAGAELQDADGNVMTQEQVNEFIKELP